MKWAAIAAQLHRLHNLRVDIMKSLKALSFAAAAAVSVNAQAEQFWADNSFTLLYGNDYELMGEATTLTIEHVSGHSWGDLFLFVDRHEAENDFSEIYGEVSPRFKLSEATFGPVNNVYAAYTYEYNNHTFGGQSNHLYGAGVDLKVPGAAFFQANVYYADNSETSSDEQLTIVYGFPFKTGSVEWMFDGYADFSTGQADHAADSHINPQLRANVGKFFGMEKSKLELGVEYSYWNNKFGIKGVEESAFSALIKYHL